MQGWIKKFKFRLLWQNFFGGAWVLPRNCPLSENGLPTPGEIATVKMGVCRHIKLAMTLIRKFWKGGEHD